MNIIILLAGALVGVNTYPGMEDDIVVYVLEQCVLWLFISECVFKIWADPCRPWMYFTGENRSWNWFDFIIVVLCMPFLPFESFAAGLRLFRLMRVLKIMSKVPELLMILTGLAAGCKAAFWILLLMFLFFYMYATAGMMFFKQGDPRHYNDYGDAFTTLYRMATCEDWTDVMYHNYYGCVDYAIGGGITYVQYDNATMGPDLFPKATDAIKPTESFCLDDPQPITSYIYFHSFIIVNSVIIIQMFVGAVAIAMIDVMDGMAEKKTQDRKDHQREIKLNILDTFAVDAEALPLRHRLRFDQVRRYVGLLLDGLEDDMGKSFMEKELAKLQGSSWKQTYFVISMKARLFSETAIFNNTIAVIIVMAGIMVGLNTDGVMDSDPVIEAFIIWIFVFEFVVKMLGEGLDPMRYFDDSWNRFDFFIVVMSFMPVGDAAVILRLLRLLRVLKLLRVFPQLTLLVTALVNSFSSLGYIAMLLFLFFYIFAIVGNIAFGINDPFNFGNVHLAMFALMRVATFEDWTDIMYVNERGCARFDNFPYPEYILGQCDTSLEVSQTGTGWFSVVYFVIFTIIGSLILLSLFIGIIAAEMEAALSGQKAEIAYKKHSSDQCELAGQTEQHGLLEKIFKLMDGITPSAGLDRVEVAHMLHVAGWGFNSDDAKEQKLFDRMFHAVDHDFQEELDFGEFTEYMLTLQTRCPWRKLGHGAVIHTHSARKLAERSSVDVRRDRERANSRQLLVLGKDSPAGRRVLSTPKKLKQAVLEQR
jgi:hypothetical protein